MVTQLSLQAEVPDELSGIRLDQIAAKLFPDYSRSRLQSWIKEGALLVNKKQLQARDKLVAGDLLRIEAEIAATERWRPQEMPLDLVFEDDQLLVINKVTDMVVHPAAGHRDGTLLNGLIHYSPQLEQVPRAGIVHRLDKDTTGLMVVAKTLEAHYELVNQLQRREVEREYEAIVQGVLTGGGTVNEPLGRHPVNRKKRAVVPKNGQEAITHYRVLNRFRSSTHARIKLETGRTHQIRVHMAHLNHPLVGDPVYGGRLRIPAACSAELAETLKNFKRQALHARRLGLVHPKSGEVMAWESQLPDDMVDLLNLLKEDNE
jgi:23S rRNA pseudouridine1911/1915/1917 synthase